MDVFEPNNFYGLQLQPGNTDYSNACGCAAADGTYSQFLGLERVFGNKETREAAKLKQYRKKQQKIEAKAGAPLYLETRQIQQLKVDRPMQTRLGTGDVLNHPYPSNSQQVVSGLSTLDNILNSAIKPLNTYAPAGQGKTTDRYAERAPGEDVVLPDMPNQKKDNTLWWIVGGGVALVGAIIGIMALSKNNVPIKK